MEAWKVLLLVGLVRASGQQCPHGQSSIKGKCSDINECLDAKVRCGNHSECVNTNGSYYCKCHTGFRTNENKDTFNTTSEQCLDYDECSHNNSCGKNSDCKNSIGSYECKCQPGYINGSQGCIDEDECENGTRCGNHTRCVNNPGRYHCECLMGYRNVAGKDTFVEGECKDINECKEAQQKEENICGEGTCMNTDGSFWCSCLEGHTTYGNKRIPCSKLDCDTSNKVPIENAGDLTVIFAMMRNNCVALSNPSAAAEGLETDGDAKLENLLTATDDILESSDMDKSQNTYAFLSTVEDFIRLIGPQLKHNHTAIETEKTDVQIAMQKGQTPPTGSIHLSSENASLDTDWATAAGTGPYPGFALAALLTYKNLESSLNQSFENLPKVPKDGVEPSFQIFTRVVSIVVSNPSTQQLSSPVTFTLRHLQVPDNNSDASFHCAFLTNEGTWSEKGCKLESSNITHTVCSCEHLSSFAVLMALYPLKDSMALMLITKIGLIVSLLCLAMCILTFKFCRSIQGTRTTIHLHLCVCLFIADLIFLVGIARTSPVGGCRLVAGLLHFFYLGVFTWMLLEGVQLYRMVVLVFNATMRPLYLYITGYGAPLAIVIISAIIRPGDYGTDRHCWLSLKHGLIWSFYGPVCLIILFNVFFFIVTVWKLVQKFSSLNPDLSKLKKIKAFTVTAIAQMCILGLMWVFGAFLFEENVVATYLFTLLNSLQGALVFVLHCLLSKQVRDEYTHFLSCLCPPRKYSDFSSTNPSSSQTQGFRSGQHTGESQI